VLSARGTVRLVVVEPGGRLLLDRRLQTDTVVGSRGDRHDALVRFVLRQVFEIAGRDLAGALR
jgi:hypothetical protein